MKRIFVLWCAAALFAVACEKENPTPAQENPMNPSDTTQTDTTQTDTTQVDPSTEVFIPNAVTDYDGNSYDAVRIGEQVWMASNLRTRHYANGEDIPNGATISDIEPYRYMPGDNESNVAAYGYLYNWPAAMHGAASSEANPSGVQGICPNGWHVPSDAEWTQLTDYCAGNPECVCSGNGSNIAKSLAADHDWNLSTNECAVGNDLSANNATGFSALPAGSWSAWASGFGTYAYFWSTTGASSADAFGRCLNYDDARVIRNFRYRDGGFSVRCVRD
ncbi:MAG: fibrobacter succinogenes major paralogous domain-containing protein [Bacteroidales bacterium]|nr:fibrobacter succinogenes major paralogous domain-containing protein [Bacteroidales bacterium]MDD6582413.1 fibrobacter succinogenes major paralogous domain-containing protein [Bacteroidales bacterium]